jgi:hypothetical protein
MNLKIIYILPVLAVAVFFNSCKDKSTDPITSNAMTKISTYNTVGYAMDVVFYQLGSNYAFIADDNAGLEIINISNPAIPVFISNYNTAGSASDVKVASINDKAYAFISDGAAGWDIIDVSQPSQLTLKIILSFPNESVICSYIETATKRAYIGTYTRMYIYDISTLPDSVTRLSVYYSADNLNAIWAEDGVAYLAQNTAGLELVNVTNPSAPAYLSAFNTPGYAMDVKLSGHFAYIADYTGMLILDVVNPFDPLPVGSYYNTDAQFNSLAYNNNGIFFTAEGPVGVETIGVGTPSAPVQLGYYNTGDYAGGVAAFGNYVLVADGNSGLVILSYTTK